MSTLASLKGARKSYGARPALRGLDLEVHRGEILALLGPNGAGKSTTMGVLAGLVEVDSGEVALFGGLCPSDPAARARVGIAPQELALYGRLTAEENLRFFAQIAGLRGGALDSRVEDCLRLAGLVDRRGDRVEGFSGGMARRLNLACAVAHEPELLLLDEPTVGVDPQSRAHLLASLVALRTEGRAIVYSTHYMEEVERLCDRIAIVDQGVVLATGTLDELVAAHGGQTRTVVRGPDLESVFLTLTGRPLRD